MGQGLSARRSAGLLAADPANRVVNPRQAHLCRQSGQPALAGSRPANFRFVRGDIARYRADGSAAGSREHRVHHASGGRKPCRPLHRRPGGLHRNQCRRHLPAARMRRWRIGASWPRRSAMPSASITSRPTKCSAICRSTTAPSPKHTPYAPSSPYSASKAASDHLVRAWHHTYGLPVVLSNCSNNYGPFHFPEKLIPLVILNALAEKPIPGLRHRRQCARLALCGGPCPRAGPGRDQGQRWARATISAGAAECTNLRMVEMLCALARPEIAPRPGGAPIATSSPLSPTGPAMTGAMPSMLQQARTRTWLDAAGNASKPALAKPSTGISAIAGGGSRSGSANMPASGWAFWKPTP